MKQRTQTIIAMFGLLFLVGTLSAQHTLQQSTTLPRSGDEYIKTELEFSPIENSKEEKNKENKIQPIEYSFYPNPVKDALNLRFRTQKGAETIVTLYELSGRETHRKTYPAENAYRNETLPMSAYPSGAYILRISCADEYVAEQIVKQ